MRDFIAKLRVAKIRNAIRRRWFERRVPMLDYATAPGIVDVGTKYGGWMIPAGLIEPGWTCYCIGAGGDVSFDLELIESYGARVVRAFDAVESLAESAREAGAGVAGFSAHHAAIATEDGPLRMQVTHDSQSQSVSSAGLYESDRFITLPGRTLPSLMAELGDDHVDLIKMDIEGGEYDVMPAIDLAAIGVKVFSIQLHHTGSVAQARGLIEGLAAAGYVPVACRPAVKITFVRRDVLPVA
ncbi:MAG TPA: FkbM family methyltransferase [Solirubrobacteraceae bacterium]|nr:FkbM family methyltransferase [Solirubrobacteraceae bacterium]